MRGKASVPVRIGRMEQQRGNRQLAEAITILAEEFALHPNEVRAELDTIERRIRQYGPEPVETGIQRLATAFALNPDDLRAEVAQIQERLRARGVLL